MNCYLFTNHFNSIKDGIDEAVALNQTSVFVEKHTKIDGHPYNFTKREYQKYILDATEQELVTQKCSQVGVSELAIRRALAHCAIIPNFTVIYTLPTAKFAGMIAQTRVSPVIASSERLSAILGDMDNIDTKSFTNGSYIYVRGSASGNAPISIPADELIHDELDFSDPGIISQYQSRLTASDFKIRLKLSTPTLPGKGINHAFKNSRRHYMMVKCIHCNHYSIPNYYRDVRIPGYKGELDAITKHNIHKIDYSHAYVACEACGKPLDLSIQHREYVCENIHENHKAKGIQVSPFDSPRIITPAYLVECSTSYEDIADFVNFNLGLPYMSKAYTLTPDEVEACFGPVRLPSYAPTSVGIDLGKICTITIVRESMFQYEVIHRENVPLLKLKARYIQLKLQYRWRCGVIDSLPYTDTVMALQELDPNLYACVYQDLRVIEVFQVKKQDESERLAKMEVRQITVNRNKSLDMLMRLFREGKIFVVSSGNSEDDRNYVEQCTDMRRVKDYDSTADEVNYRWIKSEMGNDHFFFATSYAILAAKIQGASDHRFGGNLPLIGKFKVKQQSDGLTGERTILGRPMPSK